MKLSTRLILGTTLLVLFAASAIGFFAYRALERSIYPAQLTRMAGDANLMAERLNATVEGAIADVAVSASAPALGALVDAIARGDQDATRQWRQSLAKLFEAGLKAKPEYAQLRLIGVQNGGKEIVRVDRAGPGGAIRVVPDDLLQAKGGRPYFKETVALPPGGTFVSPIELNKEFGVIEIPHMPVLRVAMPVYGDGARLFGIVIINVDLRTSFERLRASAGPGIQPYVINAAGDYLVHPDQSREFGFDLGRPAHLQDDFPTLWQDVRPAEAQALTSHIVEDRAGTDFAAAAVSRRLGGKTWIAVILMAPSAVVLAPAKAILFSTLGAAAVAILIAALVALALSRTVIRPLDLLTRAIQRFDRGEAATLPQHAPHEVGVLVSAFRQHIERERLFNAAVQSSSDAILTKTLDGTITAWNGAAEKLYGYSAAEAIGRPVRMLVPDDYLEEFERIQVQLRSGRAVEPIETVRLAKDGRQRHVSLSVSPVRSMSGELTGASEISRDITLQKQADAMFRLAVEASPAAMLMVDEEGKVALANAETLEMFGYDHEEIIGKPVEVLLPERFRAGHPALRQRFLGEPSKRMMGGGRDLYGLRRDGSEFPVEIGLNPIETPAGPMILSVVVDITERKRAAEELERRTAELQRSNAELQQFAYVASHDLQEPLRMVSSFCELLKDRYGERLDGDAVEFIDFAVDGARRMRQLINDLLDYSRLQTREAPLTSVSAQAALDGALLNLTEAIREVDAEIEVHELPQVLGNMGQLTRLFQNLIGNALKFRRPDARPKVQISAQADGLQCEFTVRDNGIGIDPKQTEQIFGVFQRLHTRDEYPGTGIGLAVCKRIVERHGGRIWAESAAGEGAVFHFTLKSPDAVSGDAAAGEEPDAMPSGAKESTGDIRRAG